MKVRILVVLAVGLLAAVTLMRDIGGGAPPPPARPRARPARPVRPGNAALPPASSRNVFEYGVPPAEPTVRVPPLVSPRLPPVAEADPVVPPAVRLVGLVRRAGVIKAALQVHGETIVVGLGEAAGDYRVLGIDEDGVRLRAADGTTITLAAGGS